MKQYLHTITRSLCIILMLCGISSSAWAQDEQDGSQEHPFIVTKDNWDEYASSFSSEYYYTIDTSEGNIEVDDSSWFPIDDSNGNIVTFKK